MKDWTGNKNSIFSTLGASNHSSYKRVDLDFYATDPVAIDGLFKYEHFSHDDDIWECACGDGHLSNRMKKLGRKVYSTDIIERNYKLDKQLDFLKTNAFNEYDMHIITNPPYKHAIEFIKRALEIIKPNYKVAMFLKLTFLEGQARRKFFDKHPPVKVLVFSKRMSVARNGDPEMFKKSSAACYAWFVWEKGINKKPTIDWI